MPAGWGVGGGGLVLHAIPRGLSTKRCPTEELRSKFYFSKMRTAAQETALQTALRNPSKEVVEEVQYV